MQKINMPGKLGLTFRSSKLICTHCQHAWDHLLIKLPKLNTITFKYVLCIYCEMIKTVVADNSDVHTMKKQGTGLL